MDCDADDMSVTTRRCWRGREFRGLVLSKQLDSPPPMLLPRIRRIQTMLKKDGLWIVPRSFFSLVLLLLLLFLSICLWLVVRTLLVLVFNLDCCNSFILNLLRRQE